jgi:hypothetical protein
MNEGRYKMNEGARGVEVKKMPAYARTTISRDSPSLTINRKEIEGHM